MYVTRPSYASRSCGFSITLSGVDALQSSETCDCCDLLVADGCFQCRECGTIYGLVHGWAKSPRRSHWRGAK
jgi:hypothetical protein